MTSYKSKENAMSPKNPSATKTAAYTELALECGALSATEFAYNGRTQKFYTFSTDELEEFCTRLMVDALTTAEIGKEMP